MSTAVKTPPGHSPEGLRHRRPHQGGRVTVPKGFATAVRERVEGARPARFYVDEEAGVIHGARILGLVSLNGRVYPIGVLRRRYRSYEGRNVYLDHRIPVNSGGQGGPDQGGRVKRGARPMHEWAGVIRDVSLGPDGIYGNVVCLKNTRAGALLLEAARKAPDSFGLSPYHVIEAEQDTAGREIVQDIVEVMSVDAVTRPATNKSLYEEVTMGNTVTEQDGAPYQGGAPGASVGVLGIEEAFLQLQNAVMASDEYDDQEKVAMLKDVMKLKNKCLGTGAPDDEPPADGEGESVQAGEACGEALRGHGQAGEACGVGGRTPKRKGRLAVLEQGMRELRIQQMAQQAGVQLTPATMDALMGLPDYRAVYEAVGDIRKQQRRPYGSAAPRSAARDDPEPASARSKVPMLSRGAKREDVAQFLSS